MRSIRITLGALAGGALLLAASALPAAAASHVIQPGSSITMGGSYCTLNWIYNGAGSRSGTVYAGTAGHCVTGRGQKISLASGSLGSAVETIGAVAYKSKALDFALIRLYSSVRSQVNPAMAGHPAIPSGVASTAETNVGDVCQFSGHGVATDATTPTQQQRVGVLVSNTRAQHYCDGVVTPGDSGGPVGDVTAGNQALGIVNTVGVATDGQLPAVGEGGVSLPGLLADARAHGYPVHLRTV
ncbi:MAG: trypsin-like serine protease [Streptosporangiales bacterium]|nr:trypsin-like serine protease [Streptosporangiales bacterium]MBO0891184.1 trypsin-like serine protease [Acidothermales bacterium]